MKMDKANDRQIEKFLEQHPTWVVVNGKLHKEIAFEGFAQAFGFMAKVAIVAERIGHHPEWCNVYSRVAIDLVTHKAGGITGRDFELAEFIDDFEQ